ncbi:bifunctional glycosyltransferase/CDP-glycerol:glycerophosphate glycerophosphotransferase [Rhizohabitans arisaemae]|uniref:bifunctional glycosyltransferase/CDP-glycerol:glycerophosphate glycerophosphotransferase n=1 Tax=Rhizohabitans arisaemae TaxID=2720610 RepID=UPI0024B13611|nr:bifunctional glycosyltransferase/CDP-glycerol:glycerophosphate glycerophosphotransferase [Rhizohabitans arisaemae]
MTPLLSVVIPFYNVELYFEECLSSLANQTLNDIEFILVDDGSLDGSAVIAKNHAVRDTRFRLVVQENQGLGRARNNGARAAKGKYLAFADSDDVLPRYAYELLVGSLEETGSDIACGGVRRLSAAGVTKSWLHVEPFRRSRRKTHVREFIPLIQDRTIWNKVYRRSFWDRHGFEFPSGLYEDSPVTVPAHVHASSVDVLRNIVYYWRMREGGGLSITQRSAELPNIADRLAAVERVGAFIMEHAPEIKPGFDKSVLDVDFHLAVNAMALVGEDEREPLLELINPYLEHVEPAVFESLTAIRRLKFHLALRRMVPELLEVIAHEQQGSVSRRPVRKGRFRAKWYADYPYFRDRRRGVPDTVYDIGRELTLRARVDQMGWSAGKLRLTGRAYVPGVEFATRGRHRIRVWLRESETGAVLNLPVEQVHRPEITADSDQSAVCLDWAGFTAELDPTWLKENGKWRQWTWELHASLTGPGIRRTSPVAGPWNVHARTPRRHAVTTGVLVQSSVDDENHLVVDVRIPRALVTSCQLTDGHLELEGWSKGDAAQGLKVVAVSRLTGAVVEAAAEVTPASSGPTGFRTLFPLADLVVRAKPPAADLTGDTSLGAAVGDGIDWDFSVLAGGKRIRLGVAEYLSLPRHLAGEREVVLVTTRRGNFSAVERATRPLIDRVEWSGQGRLILGGDLPGWADRPEHLIARRRRSGHAHRLPVRWQGDRFSVELTPDRMPGLGGPLPLASGSWDVFAAMPQGEVPVALDRRHLGALPGPRTLGVHEFTVHVHQTDALHLWVRTALAEDERGSYLQTRLRDRRYPAARKESLRDVVVFESYEGAQYSCSPRAVFEEIRSRGEGLESVWVTKDGQFAPPDGARTVLMGTREYYETLAHARYVVGNYGQQPWFVKREGQMYVQTWHGTPLKRLGFDLREMPYKRTEKLDWMEREVPRWDLLVSPNPFTTPIMRSAFRYEGEIVEYGYPRNDVFFHPSREERERSVRRRLGIPEGKRVILYAPTWRDDAHIAVGKRLFNLELDVERVQAALGRDHVLLLRTHYLITDRRYEEYPDFVIDVGLYPDIADLYLVADVLVTDYSSAMFDYANTGRPIVYFAYDLERYRDEVRGFYFDLEAAAPGPILRTTDDVVTALREVDSWEKAYAEPYSAFVAKFCPFDDGKASARIVNRMLNS